MPAMISGRTSVGVIIGMKPASTAWSTAMFEQRELELRTDPGQVVEARPGHLRPAHGVDGAEALAELEVVARREALGGEVARRADVLEHDVVGLAAGRDAGLDDVGQRRAAARPRARRPPRASRRPP